MNNDTEKGGFLHPQDNCKDTKNLDSAPTLESLKDAIQKDVKNAEPLPDELSIDALPDRIQSVIEHITDVYQCPKDFVVSGLFVRVGSVIGNKIMSYDGKFYNAPMLWVCNVASSGSNKSEPINWLMKPLRDIDRTSHKDWKSLVLEWAKSESKATERPVWHQLILDDSTPEGRNKILSNNPNGVLLYRDELRGMLDDIGRYNKSGEVSHMLSIWDGRSFRVDRKSEDPMLIEKPFLSILGTMQPDIIASSFGNSVYVAQGFNSRWLFCMPDKIDIPDYIERSIDESIQQTWVNFINNLHGLGSSERPVKIDGQSKELYVAYYNEIQEKIRKNGDETGVYAKLKIYAQRIALITEIIRCGVGDVHIPDSISWNSMEYAIRFVKYFERCNLRVKKMIADVSRPKNEHPFVTIDRMYGGIKNQTWFAKSLGISQQAVSKILKGVKGHSVKEANNDDDTGQTDQSDEDDSKL